MPRLLHHALEPSKLRGLPAGTHADGAGLALRVTGAGTRSWILRATVDGKPRNLGLGSFPGVSLAVARRKAQDTQAAIRDGRNPVAEKRAKTELEKPRPAVPNFRTVAGQVWSLRRPSWRSNKHGLAWWGSLENYVFPTLDNRPVDEITTSDILGVLEPVWIEKPATASRLQQRMKVVLDYSLARGYRKEANPAATVLAVLPKHGRQVVHHKALAYDDVADALEQIRRSSCFPITSYAIEFLALTACRSAEVRGMVWGEVDWDAATWDYPGQPNEDEPRTPSTAV